MLFIPYTRMRVAKAVTGLREEHTQRAWQAFITALVCRSSLQAVRQTRSADASQAGAVLHATTPHRLPRAPVQVC